MAATTTTVAEPAGRARWTRLIPVAIVVYVISFMDRTNIGFAFDGLGKDLHLNSAGKGLAGGDLLHRLPGAADPRRLSGRTVEREEVRRDHDPGLGRHGGRQRPGPELHRTARGAVPARRGRGGHLARHPGA